MPFFAQLMVLTQMSANDVKVVTDDSFVFYSRYIYTAVLVFRGYVIYIYIYNILYI